MNSLAKAFARSADTRGLWSVAVTVTTSDCPAGETTTLLRMSSAVNFPLKSLAARAETVSSDTSWTLVAASRFGSVDDETEVELNSFVSNWGSRNSNDADAEYCFCSLRE